MLNDLDHARFVALLRYFDEQIFLAKRELERTKILLARMSRAREQLVGWNGDETLLEHIFDECDSISRAEIVVATHELSKRLQFRALADRLKKG